MDYDYSRSTLATPPLMKRVIAYFFWRLAIGGAEHAAMRVMQALAKEDWEIWILHYEKADHIDGVVESHLASFAKLKQFPINDTAPRQVTQFLAEKQVSLLHLIWGDFRIAKSIKDLSLPIQVVASTTNALPSSEAQMQLGTLLSAMRVPHAKDVAIVAKKDPSLTDKIVVLNNGLDVTSFRANHLSNRQSMALRKELQLDNALIIGSVGNIRPVKNFSLLIQVLKTLRDSGYSVKLLIVGDTLDAAEYARISALIQTFSLTEFVTLLGFKHDIRPYLQLIDVYINSSLGTESCPNAVLEAMSMEKPIIATRNIGLEGVVEDGVNGYLVEGDDHSAICNRLKDLLSSATLRQSFGQASRRIAETNFSLDTMVAGYKEWYTSTLCKTRI